MASDLSTPEAAELLGFTRQWVNVQVRLGKIKGKKVGRGDWRISRAEVERWKAEKNLLNPLTNP